MTAVPAAGLVNKTSYQTPSNYFDSQKGILQNNGSFHLTAWNNDNNKKKQQNDSRRLLKTQKTLVSEKSDKQILYILARKKCLSWVSDVFWGVKIDFWEHSDVI